MTDRVVSSVAFIVDAVDGLQRVFKIVGRGGAVAFIALRQEALRFADGIINGPTRALNALIELYNRIPGIDISARAPDLSGSISRELELTKRMLREALADIDAIIMEPMAGDAIRERFERVRAEMETLPERARVIAPEMEDANGGSVERGAERATKAVKDFDTELDRLMQDGRRVFEQTRQPAERLAMEIERLNTLLDAGAIDWDTYSRAIFDAQDAFDQANQSAVKMGEDAGRAMSEMSVFADEAARSMQSAFADFLFDPFSKGLDGMLQDFLRVLQRMAAEAAAAKIFESIGGIFGGGKKSSGIGGIIGDVVGAVLNPFGAIGDFIGGLFADGGVTQPGKAYVVGERGPELFVPGQTGTVVPNHQMGGGSSVRIINVIDPSLVSDYLNSPGGDQAIVNVLQRNSGTVRQILA
jgi:hypothetical protein